ncbi:hypothetical protein K505DRAFT_323090 [Melanomma pulvis-pyrius CBS 109.77]|uniref:Hemerythrin-like domain-containing protein n=1 Tax=Melanomma pulvis-pyrius CBS 109.77 TaxID=1314802 RepID=A0A6A6XLC6_9PLEO|nr:hypothetical protein K505DRAFT_323090 [Melanomma pulvis-pyrius CBS 109.77]
MTGTRHFTLLHQAFQRGIAPLSKLRPRFFTSASVVKVDININQTSNPAMASINPPATPEGVPACSEKPLPKLTPSEFRQYNRMAEHMDYYHNHFRSTWTLMMTACEKNKRPDGMSIRQFLQTGQQLCSSLTMHHGIEEAHIFPVLARKMPAFQKELELLTQHKEIHKGLDQLEEYLEACRSGERELRLGELKKVLDTFGEVLWQHLDDEVKQLGAENMRKYWTLDEMKRLPM